MGPSGGHNTANSYWAPEITLRRLSLNNGLQSPPQSGHKSEKDFQPNLGTVSNRKIYFYYVAFEPLFDSKPVQNIQRYNVKSDSKFVVRLSRYSKLNKILTVQKQAIWTTLEFESCWQIFNKELVKDYTPIGDSKHRTDNNINNVRLNGHCFPNTKAPLHCWF